MQPNFLIFVTDQHRADHLGCYGNTIVRTPQIDALAAQGTRFERTYVANPVCMPNRGSMMTSRLPSIHGARGNGVPLPLSSVTFMDLLSEFGYRTALVGKSHLQNMEDKAPVLPPTQKLPGDRSSSRYPEARRDDTDPSRYEQEQKGRWADPSHQIDLPYYGFQDVVLCNGHGDECFGDWLRWLQREKPELAERVGREHGLPDERYSAPQAWRTPLDEFSYPTHFIAERTATWIREHRAAQAGQPFALMCSFPDPHHPFTPPGKYWDMYDPARMPLPPTFALEGEHEPHVKWLLEERQSGKARLDGPRLFASGSARELQEMIALTYGMITNVDDRIGLIMQALRDCGADRDTVVIFTADHGDLMGDHGIVLKGPLHYQGLVRVPFIWREPEGMKVERGAVRHDLASSMDLGASILHRAGIAPPNGTQGKALFDTEGLPLDSAREAVLIEENQQRAYLGFKGAVRMRTLVTPTHRLSAFGEGDWGELYDLQADPQETRNLWSEPEALPVKTEMLACLARTLIGYSETSPLPTRLA